MPSKNEIRKAAMRAVYKNAVKSKRNNQVSRRRSVAEVKRIAVSLGESKTQSAWLTPTDIDVPLYQLLNDVAGGDNVYQRDGNRIRMMSMEVRVGIASRDLTIDTTSGYWAIVLDRQPNGGTFTVGELYDVTAGTDRIFAMRNNVYQERFKVLHREDWTIGTKSTNSGAIDDSIPSQMTWHKYIDLTKLDEKDQLCRYASSGSGISNIHTNSLYFICVPSSSSFFAAASPYPVVCCGSKLVFKDL